MKKLAPFLLFSVAATVASAWWAVQPTPRAPASLNTTLDPASDAYYVKNVQPVFNQRCVVCHGCYSSPCQYNLQSGAGADRGAHKAPDVYDPGRLAPVQTTRLGVDAQTTADWRRAPFRFFDVSHSGVLETMLAAPGDPANLGVTPPDQGIGARTCPATRAEAAAYVAKNPAGRMPYGLPPIEPEARAVLADWLRAGAHVPDAASIARAVPGAVTAEQAKWQAFFNDDGGSPAELLRHQLVSRYLFEHLFLAHLHFDAAPGFFFRLLRSSTDCASPSEIVTRRPNDPVPESVSRVFYCLSPLAMTPVEKNHLPYRLSGQKMERLRELFFDPAHPWTTAGFRSRDLAEASNPFRVFRDIPANARYRFLLDDAEYEVGTFIKGPVCFGNGAINSIQEQFYVLFLSPDADPLAHPAAGGPNSPFYDAAVPLLELPGKFARDNPDESVFGALGRSLHLFNTAIVDAVELTHASVDFRRARNAEFARLRPQGFSEEDLWDGRDTHSAALGGSANDNALLTVFRHAESAYVLRGARGDLAKTTQVLDYSLFERLVYNLVVNFDVYDSVKIQGLTRLYKGLIRVDAEELYLSFLPHDLRGRLRLSWYREANPESLLRDSSMFVDTGNYPSSRIPYSAAALRNPARAQAEFANRILFGPLSDVTRMHLDPVNWRSIAIPTGMGSPDAADPVAAKLRAIAGVRAGDARFPLVFPDVSLVNVTDTAGATRRVFTLIRNKETKSPEMIAKQVLDADANTLVVVSDLGGSFPNLFFNVQEVALDAWLGCVQALRPSGGARDQDWNGLLRCGGVARNDPAFWKTSDAIQQYLFHRLGNRMGVLDLSRYGYAYSLDLH